MSAQLLPEAGITIERARLDRGLVDQLAVELQRLLASHARDVEYYYVGDPTDYRDPASIKQRFYRLTALRDSGFSTLKQVLALHPYPDVPDASVLVNGQESGAVQVFHPDIVRGFQIVVHASDGGKFDFSLTGNEDDYETIDVGAGDVLRLDRPSVLHRGRNPSEAMRYNMVFSSGLGIE